eukprot:TRINITY_DN453_c0_g2_i2.p1 TRINITY_DN453_c0_g2~~TRINITY_DN453_c0_g2_i2.p1  ORF type:complete len:243 (-),score=59.21 TRINITY_DN453_c0_g2_i2:192-920(-)
MAEFGDEGSLKVFCCGGQGCGVVKEYVDSLSKFFGVMFCWFKGTTIGDCLTCKGNVVADLQAVIMAQMWSSICQVLLIFTLLGGLVAGGGAMAGASAQASPEGGQGSAEAGAALGSGMVMMGVMYSGIICLNYSFTYFGLVRRNGLLCCPCLCCCIEGDLVMYLMSCLMALGGVSMLGNLVLTKDTEMKDKAIGLLAALPGAMMQFYGAFFLCKIAGMSEAERKQDLAESDDEELGSGSDAN